MPKVIPKQTSSKTYKSGRSRTNQDIKKHVEKMDREPGTEEAQPTGLAHPRLRSMPLSHRVSLVFN